MRISLRTGILAVLLFSTLLGYSQNWRQIPLPDSINPIDLVSDEEGFLYLVDKYGYYILSAGQLEKMAAFRSPVSRWQSPFQDGNQIIYNQEVKGFYELNLPSLNTPHALNISEASLCSYAENYLLIKDKIYLFSEGNWRSVQDLDTLSYWSCLAKNGAVYLINKEGISRYNEDIGLESIYSFEAADELSAFTANATELITANCNTLNIFKWDADSLILDKSMNLGISECIKNMTFHNDGLLAVGNNMMYYINPTDGSVKSTSLELELYEECIDIESDNNRGYWLLTDKKLLYHSEEGQRQQALADINLKNSYHYTIRNKDYISNGKKVFKKNKKTSEWTFDPSKNPPSQVFTPEDRHPILVFKDAVMRIHHENALILDYFRNPIKQDLSHALKCNENFYMATEDQLYVFDEFNTLSQNIPIENIISLSQYNNKVYVLCKQGLYLYTDDDITQIHNWSFDAKKSILNADKLFVLSNSNQILYYNLRTQEEELINNPSVNPQDFIISDSLLVLLNHNNLFVYELEALSSSSIEPKGSIALQYPLQKAAIGGITDKTIHILSDSSVYEIILPNNLQAPQYLVRLVKDENLNRLKTYHTNHWNSNVRYNYIFSGYEHEEAVWTDQDIYSLDDHNGKFNAALVELKNGFPSNQSRSNIVKLAHSPHINYSYYLIALLLIFASGFFGLRLIRS